MVTDQILPALVSLRITVRELEGQSSCLTLEVKQRRPGEGKCAAQGHTAIQNVSLNLSLGLLHWVLQ